MTIYYVNPLAADNTGSGLTPFVPKKTIPTLAPGDRVRLYRGTTYTGNEWATVPGTSAAHIVFEAYWNIDGSDNPNLARPIINRTTPTGTYSSTNKDYVDVFNLDIRGTLTVGNDVAMLYLGQGCTVRGVRVDTNVGAAIAWNSSNVTIEACELNGVSHTSANNNNVVTVSADNTSIDSIRIAGNIINHKGGGGTGSHLIRAETASPLYDLTNLVVDDNTGIPAGGAARQSNVTAMGVRVGRCPVAKVRRNRMTGAFTGVYANGGGAVIAGLEILDNIVDNCYQFGIHLPGGTRDCKIGRNVVDGAGSNLAASNYYGRGIEISSGGGQGQNGGHEIFKNKARYCQNWGGPSDNGSEGVGIGLDDGTDTCYVWGNTLAFNEGNGIQQYGGASTDSGGHRIVSNTFENNCTAAIKNRRTGGTLQTAFVAECAFSSHKGTPSICANNVFVNAKCGVSEAGNNDDILDKANNIFYNVQHPVSMPATFTRASNNLFFAFNVAMVRYTNSDLDANGTPAFTPIGYTGVNDVSYDPLLDAANQPRADSPVANAGVYLGAYNDATGVLFKNPPSIGMFELFGNSGPVAGEVDTGDGWDEDADAASIMVPVDVINTDGLLKSVTANGVEMVEDSNALWNVGSTYGIGQRVYMASTHRVYESAKDGNTGKIPTDITNQVNAAGVATWWTDVGPTNKYAMFDGLVSSQTVAASPMVITLAPGPFNGFAIFGADADTFAVQVVDGPGGNVIYNEPETALEGSDPTDYYDYFLGRFKPLTQFVRTNLEPYGTAQIKLTLSKATGTVKLGMFAIGDMRPSGIPQRDATVEPQDFSVVKRDAFGNTFIKKRANATGMSITTMMGNEDAGAVLDSIKDVLGVPVVVVGSSAALYEWMTVFGLVSARVSPQEYPFVKLSMTVQGTI